MDADTWIKEAKATYTPELAAKIQRVMKDAERELKTRDRLLAEQAKIIQRYSALCDECDDARTQVQRALGGAVVVSLGLGLLIGALIW